MDYRAPDQMLEDLGAVITGSHFQYSSGRHGSDYVNKDAVYPHVEQVRQLCNMMALDVFGFRPDVVVAPAIGGVILGQWMTYQLLGFKLDVLSVYAEKETIKLPDTPEGYKCYAETGRFVIKRGYEKLVAGKRVLVVEDVLNTGETARKTVEAAEEVGGEVVAACALNNRGGVTKEVLGVPELICLTSVDMVTHDPADCPICKQGIPMRTDLGHGKNAS